MQKKKKKRKGREPMYFIDMWSIPHFLFGEVVAMFALVLGIPLWPTILITLCLAIIWEYIERKMELHEARWNITMDVCLPIIAALVTYAYVPLFARDDEHLMNLLFISMVIYGALTWFAWEARADGEPGFMS